SFRENVRAIRERHGLSGIPAGSTLVAINGQPVSLAEEIERAAHASAGRPLTLTFETPDGAMKAATIDPRAEFTTALVAPSVGPGPFRESTILGLTPALSVERTDKRAAD